MHAQSHTHTRRPLSHTHTVTRVSQHDLNKRVIIVGGKKMNLCGENDTAANEDIAVTSSMSIRGDGGMRGRLKEQREKGSAGGIDSVTQWDEAAEPQRCLLWSVCCGSFQTLAMRNGPHTSIHHFLVLFRHLFSLSTSRPIDGCGGTFSLRTFPSIFSPIYFPSSKPRLPRAVQFPSSRRFARSKVFTQFMLRFDLCIYVCVCMQAGDSMCVCVCACAYTACVFLSTCPGLGLNVSLIDWCSVW